MTIRIDPEKDWALYWSIEARELCNEAHAFLTPLAFELWVQAVIHGVDVQDRYERGAKLLQAHKENRFVGLKPYLGSHPSEWGF